jgi:hypothetical protein
MDDHTALVQLEELAQRLGIKVRYETIKGSGMASLGGLVVLKGERVIIVNAKAKPKDKIQTLVRVLKQFNLEEIYIRPALRKLIGI